MFINEMNLDLQALPGNVNELQAIVLKKCVVIVKSISQLYESERNTQEKIDGQFPG